MDRLIAFLICFEIKANHVAKITWRFSKRVVIEIVDMLIYMGSALIFIITNYYNTSLTEFNSNNQKERELRQRAQRSQQAMQRTVGYKNYILNMDYNQLNDFIVNEIVTLTAQYCYINRPYMDKNVFILDTDYYTELRVYITGIVLSNLHPLLVELDLLHFPGVLNYVFNTQYDIARIDKIPAVIVNTLKAVKEVN